MQFAVIGANETLLPLLRSAADEGHECVATIELGRWASQISTLAPDAIRDPAWELLLGPPPVELAETRVDAVVVALDHEGDGADRERRVEQLRKLAVAGMPMILVTPVCEGIVGYELDMIRRDTNVVLFPYSPLALHEGAARIRGLIESGGSIGEVEQLVLERTAAVGSDTQRLELFAQDAHLIDVMLGGLREVSASSGQSDTLEQLAAHVQGRRSIARWTLMRGSERSLRVSALGSDGRAEWTVCDSALTEHVGRFGHGSWAEGSPGSNAVLDSAPLIDNGAVQTWQAFEQRCQDLDAPQPVVWEGACRAAEVADHTPRSVRRGRAVAMQDQTPTEEDTFKGMMAAGSCGILMLVLFIFVVVGVFESVRFPALRNKFLSNRDESNASSDGSTDVMPDLTSEVARSSQPSIWWRIWPVYPLGFLLALQLLRFVFPKPQRSAEAQTPGNS